MKRTFSGGLAVAVLVLAHGPASGADDAGPVTEIEVTGQRTLLQLRQEASIAEDAVYGLWNDLNDEKLFDIQCVSEAPTGSVIKRKQCAPRFVAEATEEIRRDFFRQAFASSGGGTVATGDPFADIQKHLRRYQQKMKDTILQSPALQEAVLKHQRLLDELEHRSEADSADKQERD